MKKHLTPILLVLLLLCIPCIAVHGATPVKQTITKLSNEKTGTRITWSKSSNAAGYKIYRKINNGGWQMIKNITNRNTTYFIDTTVQNGIVYTYAVRGYIGNTMGASNTLSIFRLRAPGGISKCVSEAPGKVTLAWDVNGKATGYQVVYADNPSFANAVRKRVNGYANRGVTVSGLTGGKTYYFMVQTYKTINGKTYYSCYSKAKNTVVKKDNSTPDPKKDESYYLDYFCKAKERNKKTDGTIDETKVYDSIYNKAKEGLKEGTVKDIEKTKDGVAIELNSGITFVYQIDNPELDASGTSMSITTMQPYYSSYEKYDKQQSNEATDYSAQKISLNFQNYSFKKNYNDEAVTTSTIKNFTNNELVFLHSHGYYLEECGSIIWLGEKISSNDLRYGSKYYEDLCLNRLYITSDYRLGFTSKYVDKYCGNLYNSFFYLGTCYSGKDNRLAYSLINKGASTVIGNNESIWRQYNVDIMELTFDSLLEKDNSGNYYNTIEAALALAKNRYGGNDREWHKKYYGWYDGVGATPVIFGDRRYRLSYDKITVAVSSIALNTSSVTIDVGKTYTLTATIFPSNATNKTVTWSSSNTSVATVSNGVVTGKTAGTATITATTNNGKTASCAVNIINPYIAVTGISLNTSSVTIDVGKTYTFTATVFPSNATNKTVTWSSSNTSVATVSNGVVTGKTAGTATITATTNNGKTASCAVNVVKPVVAVTSVTLNRSSVNIEVGKTYTLTATVSPSNATNKTITWSSSNTSVATVNNGVVTKKAAGTATITAKSNNGKTASCTVGDIPVSSISLNVSNVTIDVGKTYTLTATILPNNATNKVVTWSSSNTSVATVNSNGVVTGKSEGTATITAKTNNGKVASCMVKVMRIVMATSITLLDNNITIDVGMSYYLQVMFTPLNPTNQNITWNSSNTSVATVINGSVTGKSEGKTTITARTDNGKTASCIVTVKNVPITIKPYRNVFLNYKNQMEGDYQFEGVSHPLYYSIIYVNNNEIPDLYVESSDGRDTHLYIDGKGFYKGNGDKNVFGYYPKRNIVFYRSPNSSIVSTYDVILDNGDSGWERYFLNSNMKIQHYDGPEEYTIDYFLSTHAGDTKSIEPKMIEYTNDSFDKYIYD